MHRNQLITQLENYNPELEVEKEFRVRFLDFVRNHEDCFLRSQLSGHITGSAWITNSDRSKFLMTHHAKLDKWLQLGGHADGEADILKVALKEAQEESGLSKIKVISSKIFDIDIHTIPGRKGVPEHLHYDVRFLLQADDNDELTINRESKNLAWLTLEELNTYCQGYDSILRMAYKSKKETLSPKSPF